MSGYDMLRAMRKGSETDPEFEKWKNTLVEPEPIPISDTQHQMHIDLVNDDLFEDDGTMDMNGSIFPTLREIKESGDKDLYNLAAEQGSTDIFEFDDDPPERIGTPYPERETTQTRIDAHAAGGDNVWQRGQTARQQAAMARDAQQARDLARPYRMAPKVAYKQAQEKQNMEPTEATKKSAMPELPSISSMIKGKREDPRENLFEFKKRDTRLDQARQYAANHNNADLGTRNLIYHDLYYNDGDRTGVIYDRGRDSYTGSHVGRTPFLGDIPERRDKYINDMDARTDTLWSMDDELYDGSDDIADYAKQYGLDPDNLRSFIITLRNHYRDNRRSAGKTKENLSSVIGDESQDEES